MMFERSEFLPPQALRQAATDEVRTDRRILQQRMLMQFVNLLCKSTTLTAYSRAQCRRSLHRTGCEKAMLSTFSAECRTQLPMFWYFFSKKYREKELKKNTSGQLRLGTAVEFDDERKRVFRWRGIEPPPQLRCSSP